MNPSSQSVPPLGIREEAYRTKEVVAQLDLSLDYPMPDPPAEPQPDLMLGAAKSLTAAMWTFLSTAPASLLPDEAAGAMTKTDYREWIYRLINAVSQESVDTKALKAVDETDGWPPMLVTLSRCIGTLVEDYDRLLSDASVALRTQLAEKREQYEQELDNRDHQLANARRLNDSLQNDLNEMQRRVRTLNEEREDRVRRSRVKEVAHDLDLIKLQLDSGAWVTVPGEPAHGGGIEIEPWFSDLMVVGNGDQMEWETDQGTGATRMRIIKAKPEPIDDGLGLVRNLVGGYTEHAGQAYTASQPEIEHHVATGGRSILFLPPSQEVNTLVGMTSNSQGQPVPVFSTEPVPEDLKHPNPYDPNYVPLVQPETKRRPETFLPPREAHYSDTAGNETDVLVHQITADAMAYVEWPTGQRTACGLDLLFTPEGQPF